ncbi:hypothetical protein GCM10009557_88210 [Virgisporangium ochraceum]
MQFVPGVVTGLVGAGVLSVRISCGPLPPFSVDWKRAIALVALEVTPNVYVPAFATTVVTSKDTDPADAAGFTVATSAPTEGAFRPVRAASVHDVAPTLRTDTDDGNGVEVSRDSFTSALATVDPAGRAATVNLTNPVIRSPPLAPATTESLPPNPYVGRAEDT